MRISFYKVLSCTAVLSFYILQSTGFTRVQEVTTPDLSRKPYGYYAGGLRKNNKFNTCNQVLTEDDDIFRPFRLKFYDKLSKNWFQFSSLGNQNFAVQIVISKTGTLLSYKPIKGLENPVLQSQFSELLKQAFPLDPIPKALSNSNTMIVVTRKTIDFFARNSDPEKRELILNQPINESLGKKWIRKSDNIIHSKWKPIINSNSRRAEVLLYVDDDGDILKRTILTSSCSIENDNRILEAIDLTKSLPPPPFKSPIGFTKVILVFEYQKFF